LKARLADDCDEILLCGDIDASILCKNEMCDLSSDAQSLIVASSEKEKDKCLKCSWKVLEKAGG